MKSFEFTIRAFISTNSSNSISIDSRLLNFFTSIDSSFQNFREFTFINDDVLFTIESFINQFAQRKIKVRLKQSKVTLFVRIVCQFKNFYLFHQEQRDVFYNVVSIEFHKKVNKNLIKNIVRTKLQKFAKNRRHEIEIQKNDIV